MDKCIKEYVSRSLLARGLLGLKRFRSRRKALPLIQRSLGTGGSLELYFAFDDPCSAIALPAISNMVVNRDLTLELYPVVERGIAGDPDLELRRAYYLKDAYRLGRRLGIDIKRSAPLDPSSVSFLAAWAESARETENIEEFSRLAISRIWSTSEKAISLPALASIYERSVGQKPPQDVSDYDEALAGNSARLVKKGHWDTPALLVYGEWYFAHERLEQIEDRLRMLGW